MTLLAPPERKVSYHGFMVTPTQIHASEDAEYRDTGCRLHAACLTCPLEVCLYDDPGTTRRLIRRDSDTEVLRLRAEGLTVTQVAQRLGLSRRTVFRISANARAANFPVAASAEGLAGQNKVASMPRSPVQGSAASRPGGFSI